MKNHTEKPARRLIIPLLTVICILFLCNTVQADESVASWTPFSPAPSGQIGGAVIGEYDWRTIDPEDITVQRVLLRMGWAPVKFASIWIEGGVAALSIESDSLSLKGDFGTAVGAGMTLSSGDFSFAGVTPFISARATMFISRISDDDRMNEFGSQITERRRYEWLQGYGLIGLSLPVGSGLLFGGLALRGLSQEEERLTNYSGQEVQETNTYTSGLKPGLTAAVLIPMKGRFTTCIAMEAYLEGMRISLTFGQWGTP
ncbi:hypothetical protein HQ587_03185 [bacterium]|nr:hypothetical protein [bacterium]